MKTALEVSGTLILAGLLALAVAASQARAADASATEPVAAGPFKPDWDSLQQYDCPAWFRDAKFGIWAHWSAQCVPEHGDWYARGMYEQGSSHYKYHLEHYGHPSKVGFKDICHLWKAENWEPEKLIALYKRAGAKYFVALANHHCNFDCWDSKYQPWNSVNIGPKKDIVGIWAKAARAAGLRFGATVHCARAWSWYEVAHGSDKDGPMKGVPYDGVLTKADGKGLWWDGYDPQDLYCRTHKPGEPPDQAYVDKWFHRVKDLIDHYHPDLLYFDDHMLPLGEAGMKVAAHYYNANLQWHDGKQEAVLTTKGMPPQLRKTLVWDIERGRSDRLEPYPWQTDTCIGQWHYNRGIRYKTADQVIPMLVDIVSKNGNLLLNIPVRGDGTIDDDEVHFLEEMAKWMPVNGEGIFGTRPWKVFGEGRTRTRAPRAGEWSGSFNEGGGSFKAQDLRFTTKGDALYAFFFAWPADRKLVVRSLAKPQGQAAGAVTAVSLLGSDAKLEWSQDDKGLAVALPEQKPCDYAFALKIEGKGLQPAEVPEQSSVIRPAADGSLTLDADGAELHGVQVQVESRGGHSNVGFWDNPKDWISWKLQLPKGGAYQVTASIAAAAGDSELVLEAPGQQLAGKAARTNGWDDFQAVALGKLELKQAGECVVKLRPRDAATWKPINLRFLKLAKAD